LTRSSTATYSTHTAPSARLHFSRRAALAPSGRGLLRRMCRCKSSHSLLLFDAPSTQLGWNPASAKAGQGKLRSCCSCGKQAQVPSHGRPAAQEAMEPLQLFAVHAHGGAPTCVCLSSRGSAMLLSGGSDAAVNLWSAVEPRPIMVGMPFTCIGWTCKKGSCTCAKQTVHVGPTGHVMSRAVQHLDICSKARRLRAACAQRLRGQSAVCCVALDAGDEHAAAGGADGSIRLFDLCAGRGGPRLPAQRARSGVSAPTLRAPQKL
jgi:WD40 repeat protein